MKTLMIWIEFENPNEQPVELKYFVLEGNLRHLNRVFINYNKNTELTEELISIIENDNLQEYSIHDISDMITSKEINTIITCGWL